MSRPVDSISDMEGSEISYSDSRGSYDTLDELLTRFTLEFRPDYVFKLRNRLGPLIVGADVTHIPDHGETLGAIVVKPVERNQWWRRLRMETNGTVALRSRKLRWWLFTLDVQAGVNPVRRTTDASFRVATKWDVARGEYHNKKRVAMGDATEGRVHWSVNYNLPEVAGSFGSSSRNVSRDVHAELGYAHAEVAKVELVVWPWRNNPRRQLRMEANGEVHEGAGTADVTANEDGWAADQTAEGAVKASADRSGGGPIGKGKEVLAQLQHHIKELQHSWQPDGSASTS